MDKPTLSEKLTGDEGRFRADNAWSSNRDGPVSDEWIAWCEMAEAETRLPQEAPGEEA